MYDSKYAEGDWLLLNESLDPLGKPKTIAQWKRFWHDQIKYVPLRIRQSLYKMSKRILVLEITSMDIDDDIKEVERVGFSIKTNTQMKKE
ncbi:hypothetical protein TSAR_014631 [Trichomalopsis sarcophagae]|uniref:Uncharacterized protein n=1 Tax=Trichomalopsis sarcophagae TaxID=543379 RepID=A0A232EEZ3_9HYME|nr:hypothetical protein TSAR_014631 [Trichomalopsis sarcophagae]